VSQKGAHRYAEEAVKLNENDYQALMVLGRTNMYLDNFEQAEYYLRRSLRMNPNDADNLIQLASCFTYLGYHDESERLYKKAMRLNPLNQDWYNGIGAFIYFELGDAKKCLELGKKVSLDKTFVDLSAYLAGASFELDEKEECHFHWNNFLKIFSQKISGTGDSTSGDAVEWIRKVNPYRHGTRMTPFLEYILNAEAGLRPTTKVTHDPLTGCFRKEEGIWKLGLLGNTAIMKDMKGLQDIQTLLMNPGKDIYVLDLIGGMEADKGVEILDDQARKEIQEKIRILTEDLEEAEVQQNYEQISKLRQEYDTLVDHLSASLGKGGRSRNVGSSVEKARSAITWRIRSSTKKMEPIHPKLSRHLSNSIKPGTYCTYQPESVPDWEF
jgi:tetratricopeptide (TPR) repeat protein